MGVTASISIVLDPAPVVSKVLDVLHAGGWNYCARGFEDVYYEHGFGQPWGAQAYQSPLALWPESKNSLDRFQAAGENVGVCLHWAENDALIDCNFWHSEPENLIIFFDGSRRQLEGCEKFTDFSWYLKRIVQPLMVARMNPYKITCEDDW